MFGSLLLSGVDKTEKPVDQKTHAQMEVGVPHQEEIEKKKCTLNEMRPWCSFPT